MLRKVDSKPIFFKYLIGNTANDDSKPIYSEILETFCHIYQKNGQISNNVYGQEFDFDIAILMNYNKETKLINEGSAFYIEEMPTSIFPNGDYEVKRIGDVKLNTFVIYLTKIDGVNYPKVYFEKNGEILVTQFNFDKKKLVGYMPINRAIPFDKQITKIWTYKPTSISSKRGLIKLTNIKKIYSSYIELTFEKNETV